MHHTPKAKIVRGVAGGLIACCISCTTWCNAGLVAHWKLDEGSGETFADSVAGNNGFLPDDSIVEWVTDGPPGIQSVSVEFLGDEGPSFIETPFEGIAGDDPRTIALWVKAEPQDRATALVAWGTLESGRKWHFRIENTRIRTEFMGGQNFGGDTDVADGEWHHVVSVFPPDGFEGDDIIHYVDGIEEPKLGGTSIPIDTGIGGDACTVNIGFACGHEGRWFQGQIADVRIYDEALDEAAIMSIMLGEDQGVRLQPGDADQDLDFDQLDLVAVQIAAKYLSGQAATWGEGDWNGAPGGSPGSPPDGDGQFNQLDIIAALGAGAYLTGPYGAIAAGGMEADGQTSVKYDPASGEIAVDAPAGVQLTSINIDSATGIFTGAAAANLGGSFDNDADGNIFKATFGGSFGSVSFGNVAAAGLSQDFLLGDLTVVGSLAGGGDLGEVDLIYVPEPTSLVLLVLALGLAAVRLPRQH